MKTLSVNKNKTLNVWKLAFGLVLAVGFLTQNVLAATDVLHFSAQTTMMNTGNGFGGSDASGKVTVTISRQGNVDNQELIITTAHLDPGTTYGLVAYLGTDTNATSITNFTTGTKGSFAAIYINKDQKNLNSRITPLPGALDPLCNVRELDVVDEDTNVVLRAILTEPDKGQYLVKHAMSNTGLVPAAVGALVLQANAQATKFQLQASHLAPNTNYRLVINDTVAPASLSDSSGKLILKTLPAGSPAVLDIQLVALADNTGTNIVLVTGGFGVPCTLSGQGAINLRSAAKFAVLAGATVANTDLTTINGNLGLSPGSAVTGFPPGVVNGDQHVADPTAAQAKLDLTTAYNDAAGRTVAPILVAGNLGGMTLAPGLYKSSSSLEISSGDLTLDAHGDANGVFIFQMASTLITSSGRQVILSGGAKASNVFWQVGTSATLGTTSVFKGNIMADQSITLDTGATLEGRALTRVAAVNLHANTITIPAP